jgi:hypothetical protein
MRDVIDTGLVTPYEARVLMALEKACDGVVTRLKEVLLILARDEPPGAIGRLQRVERSAAVARAEFPFATPCKIPGDRERPLRICAMGEEGLHDPERAPESRIENRSALTCSPIGIGAGTKKRQGHLHVSAPRGPLERRPVLIRGVQGCAVRDELRDDGGSPVRGSVAEFSAEGFHHLRYPGIFRRPHRDAFPVFSGSSNIPTTSTAWPVPPPALGYEYRPVTTPQIRARSFSTSSPVEPTA